MFISLNQMHKRLNKLGIEQSLNKVHLSHETKDLSYRQLSNLLSNFLPFEKRIISFYLNVLI